MKRKMETVWTDESGRMLLRRSEGESSYSVIPAAATVEDLAQLGMAIIDALHVEPEGEALLKFAAAPPPWVTPAINH